MFQRIRIISLSASFTTADKNGSRLLCRSGKMRFKKKSTVNNYSSNVNSSRYIGRRLFFCLILFASLGATRSANAGDDVPAWVRQAVSTRAPAYGKKIPAVVLLNEKSIKVEEDGKVTTSKRYAIRILTNEGKSAARGSVFYITESSKVKDMKGWLLRPTEQVKKYGKDEILDRAAALNDVFNEVRIKAINASSDAEPDAVFAYEAV